MNRTLDDMKSCTHGTPECGLPAFAHGECETHFWRDCSCGHQSSHSWASTETDLAGDVALMCDLCFMEFVLDECRGGIFSVEWQGVFLHRDTSPGDIEDDEEEEDDED
jgi:hypothetical protein